MNQWVRLGLLGVFVLAVSASAANAAPIVCSATLVIGGGGPPKFFEGSVDPALACTAPIKDNNVFPSDLSAFGVTWLAQDKDGDAGPLHGATENVLTLTGLNTTGGTFTIDPANSQCGLVDCNIFVFGLKFGPVVSYWNLGAITAPTTFNWTTNKNALSNGAVYARFEDVNINVPEPGLVLLFAMGAATGLRRRYTASR